jgi:DNA polymerase-4
MKIIVHIDLNAFFVQCEILRDPSLRGKPVAIGHDSRRGVLSTASYEARKFGVNSAMPVSTAKRKCPQLILVPGHYELYQQYSHEFFSYLKTNILF